MEKGYVFELSSVAKNTVLGAIQGIKVDFLTHSYPSVRDYCTEGKLRLASVEDIGAMKLNAIAHSGQRLKDFIDVYFILEHFPLQVLLNAYEVKYPHSNSIVPLKALTYFDDLSPDESFPVMSRKIHRKELEARLIDAVKQPDYIF